MIADDMKAFMEQPWAMASDGGVNNNHPRGAGTFPACLGASSARRKWPLPPWTVKKMTSMPCGAAEAEGLRHDRGRHEGGPDDLRSATILDRSTFEQRLRARGINRVFVNGRPVWSVIHQPTIGRA